MFKTCFLRTVFLTTMLGLFVVNVGAQTLTLSASDTVCTGSGIPCLNWTDSITGSPNSNPSLNVGGGYWSDTYLNTTGFGIGQFKLTHGSGASQYSYWGGFTSGSNGDDRNYGFADTAGHSGSVNWVSNQWGVMAGGGINTTTLPITPNMAVSKDIPYLIAYWDYFSESMDPNSHSLQISLANNATFTPQSVWICNHPWPYYGNLYGDGFARPLNRPGDYFRLIIHGVKADDSEVTVTHTLTEYDDVFGEIVQSPEWKLVDLTGLGSNIKYVYFTMESTDEFPPYGPNTAVYFCIDKLKVIPTGGFGPRPNTAPVQTVKAPSAKAKAVEVTDYFPITSYAGGDVVVYDAGGKKVLNMRVEAGEKINLSMLPAGEYRLQHGHKVIPINKK